MDTNRHGREVQNIRCVLCQEAAADVSYEEHVRHVDFIAARGMAHGYNTPSPSAKVWAAEFSRANQERTK